MKMLSKTQKLQLKDIQTLEDKITTAEDEAIFLGEFVAGLIIRFDIDEASKALGNYFPQFWAAYTARDAEGARYVVSELKTTKKNYFKVKIRKPELLVQGLETGLNYLIEKSEKDVKFFMGIHRQAVYVSNKQLADKVAMVIVNHCDVDYEKLLELAKSVKSSYLLFKAGELMKTEGSYLMKMAGTINPKNHSTKYRPKKEYDDSFKIYMAARAYRDAWQSHNINERGTNKLSKTFKKQKYDNRESMRLILKRLTGKGSKEIMEFENRVYSMVNRIIDWDHYATMYAIGAKRLKSQP